MGQTQGTVAEIVATYYASTTFDELQALLAGGAYNFRKSIARQLSPIFSTEDDPHRAQRALWEKYFREYFDMRVDLSQVRVPAKPEGGKWRLIAVAKGQTMNHAVAMYKKVLLANDSQWNLWKYVDDLDVVVMKNVRTSAESYFIWARDEPEPDKGYVGKSTEVADPDMQIGETLLERFNHGIAHFVETKKHLDGGGVTLCTGSRDAVGRVPYMDWYPGNRKLSVFRCSVRDANPRYGLRQAVS